MLADSRGTRQLYAARRRSERMRGYGPDHQKARRVLAPFVASGLANCARCGEPIEAGEPWDLGHDDFDRRFHSGPEHARCNRGAPNRLQTTRLW